MLHNWSFTSHITCQNTLWTLKNFPVRFVTLDNARKNTPKSFRHFESCISFKKNLFSTTLRCYRNGLVTPTRIVRIPCCTVYIVPWGLSHSIFASKKRPKPFLHWAGCLLFQKFEFFQQPLRCYRNDLAASTVIVKIPCEAWQVVPGGLSHTKMREKIGQNLLFTEKIASFLKKLCFHQPLRSLRNDIITSTVSVRLPFGPS